jgi:hypothetical protein
VLLNRLRGLIESKSIVVEHPADLAAQRAFGAEVAHHGRHAVMPGHGHRLGQRHVLPAGFRHEPGPERVRRKLSFNPRQRTSLLDDVAHGRRREWLAEVAALADAPEEGAFLDAAGGEPLLLWI